jgi:2,4-dienoyl-CoA reductase-like NADH-dependent reductase (Old Yellow Enzyme family)
MHEDGLYTIRGEKLPLDAVFKYSFNYKQYRSLQKWIIRQLAPLVKKKIKPYENYNVGHAQEIRKHVNIPVIVVGGITSLDSIKTIISEQKADFVSMSRPFIIEPTIVKKFKEGTQTKSKCIACNYCGIASEVNQLKCYNGKVD